MFLVYFNNWRFLKLFFFLGLKLIGTVWILAIWITLFNFFLVLYLFFIEMILRGLRFFQKCTHNISFTASLSGHSVNSLLNTQKLIFFPSFWHIVNLFIGRFASFEIHLINIFEVIYIFSGWHVPLHWIMSLIIFFIDF